MGIDLEKKNILRTIYYCLKFITRWKLSKNNHVYDKNKKILITHIRRW